MARIIYSFNKHGFEEAYWRAEIGGASDGRHAFIPFNHGNYLSPSRYVRAQLLDNLYYNRDAGLLRMYSALKALIIQEKADALIVDNCFPYHPEFLLELELYKVIRTSDGPMTAYDRDFAFLHAYDHVLFHSPAYSQDMDMEGKLRYCGAKRIDFLPLGSFDAMCDRTKTDANILELDRDIDVIFIGALYPNKMPLLAKVKKTLGKRLHLYGMASLKKNIYFNVKYGFPGWVRPVPFSQYVALYQRSKIGINIHNRGDYTVGSFRLFDLPANGVMQISDGGKYLERFYSAGNEIVAYSGGDDLIEKVEYYLDHEVARRTITLNGFKRVNRDYRIAALLKRAGDVIQLEIMRSGTHKFHGGDC